MADKELRFHPAAEAELNEAADWYEDRRPGLGLEFATAVRQQIDAVLEAPRRWRLISGTRRALLGRFPYAIVYRENAADEVEIVAVAHFRRRPKFWTGR